MTATATRERLSAEEREAFARNGFVTPSWRLPDSVHAALRAKVDRLIESNPKHRPEQIVCPHILGGADGSLQEDPGLRDFFLAKTGPL